MKTLLQRLIGWLFSFVWKSDPGGVSPVCERCRHAYENHYPLDTKAFDDPQAKRPCHHVGGHFENDCTCPNYVPAL